MVIMYNELPQKYYALPQLYEPGLLLGLFNSLDKSSRYPCMTNPVRRPARGMKAAFALAAMRKKDAAAMNLMVVDCYEVRVM